MSNIYDFDFVEKVYTVEETNTHLKDGWKLINTYTTCDPMLPGDEELIFVLGHIGTPAE